MPNRLTVLDMTKHCGWWHYVPPAPRPDPDNPYKFLNLEDLPAYKGISPDLFPRWR
jgi:hypothetical protein